MEGIGGGHQRQRDASGASTPSMPEVRPDQKDKYTYNYSHDSPSATWAGSQTYPGPLASASPECRSHLTVTPKDRTFIRYVPKGVLKVAFHYLVVRWGCCYIPSVYWILRISSCLLVLPPESLFLVAVHCHRWWPHLALVVHNQSLFLAILFSNEEYWWGVERQAFFYKAFV